jgi:exportin-T
MTLMQFCNQQYATEKSMPVFLKNKLAHAVVLLMVQQFPREWPTFFDEILLWAQSTGNESTELVDLFLRICLSIDEEVVCLYISRSDEETLRNTNIVCY